MQGKKRYSGITLAKIFKKILFLLLLLSTLLLDNAGGYGH